MGAMTGGTNSRTGTTSTHVYTGIQIQTSTQSLPIPILWGTNRLAPNIINYINFRHQDASKGKGGKSGNQTYFADVQLALCEGASAGYTTVMGKAWDGQAHIEFVNTGFGLYPGTATQGIWPNAAHAGQNLNYAYTVVLAQGGLALGPSASIPSYNFEVLSTFQNHNVNNAGSDANFGDIIPDFLTNPRYGVGFDSTLLSGFDTLTTYHLAQGIFVSPLLKDPEQVTATLQRWATIGNFWIFWSGTQLKVVCLGDGAITANGVTYTPNTTPVYNLGPDDFRSGSASSNTGEPPVTVTRKDPADCYNIVQLDAAIRGHNYETSPYMWQDQASIDAVGVQSPNIVSSTEICNVNTAATVAALIGLRQLYIRNTYKFKLLPNFILLEPGDIVTLTEPHIGLFQTPVRLLEVSEDDKGVLDFTAEEFPGNVGSAYIQSTEPWSGAPPYDPNVAPGSVNTPAFVQPDTSLTSGLSEIWIATSGGQYFGGCAIYLSFDGLNYNELGQNAHSSYQGTLTASTPAATGLDNTNPLAVDLTECDGVLPATATTADADAYRTLILVENELMAYGRVTPTGTYTSNLTYLRRGLYGTTPQSHSVGAAFSRIDQTSIFAYTLPAAYLGATLHFKFPTVNVFGNSAQALSDCTDYTFTPPVPPPPTVPPPVNGPTIRYAAATYDSTLTTLTGVTVAWTPAAGVPTPAAYAVHLLDTYGAPTTAGSSGFTTTLYVPFSASSSKYPFTSATVTSANFVGVASNPSTSATVFTPQPPTGLSVNFSTGPSGHTITALFTAPTPTPDRVNIRWANSGSTPYGTFTFTGPFFTDIGFTPTLVEANSGGYGFFSVQSDYGGALSTWSAPVAYGGTP